MKKGSGGQSLKAMVRNALDGLTGWSASPYLRGLIAAHVAKKLGGQYVKTRPGYMRLVAAARRSAGTHRVKSVSSHHCGPECASWR